MDTKKLRQKILDLAIRGKLVPQDPNDEPASVLLERIRAEKEQLIKEGKIKRSKKSAATDKSHYENVPFEIPESWCWTTIDELLINRDSERVPLSSTIRKKQVNKVYDYYGAAGVIDKVEGYLFNEKLLLIGEDGANLLSRSKDNAFFADGKYWVNNHAHVLDCCYKSILTYVAYLINSISLEPFVTGTAQPKLSQDNLNKIPIALPPIKEQARIVAGIEKWVGFIDEIEAGKIELESYIKQTKSKILDLAISGKLVPQDPNDEPAIELLKRINPDFEPCDNSHYENIEFDIPKNWVWATIGDIFEHNTGKALNASNPNGTMLDYITTSNLYWDRFELSIIKQMPFTESEIERCIVRKGDLLICEGGDVGRAAIWDYDYNIMIQNHIHRLRGKVDICTRYFFYLFMHYKLHNLIGGKGVAIQGLSSRDLHNLIIPVPSLKEQYDIASSIDLYFSKLDMITAEL